MFINGKTDELLVSTNTTQSLVDAVGPSQLRATSSGEVVAIPAVNAVSFHEPSTKKYTKEIAGSINELHHTSPRQNYHLHHA